MTTGQRIAAKRKELSLSQEALGEALNVSRQSIYKWESDTSLPDIDKLVALSRLFSVPVGWLLGVEEENEPSPDTPDADQLTEGQMKLLEEILSRYQQEKEDSLTAQQVEELLSRKLAERPKKKKSSLTIVLAGAALCALVLVCFNLFSKLEQMESRYNSLSNAINNVTHNVNSQIGGITDRVEEILKAQNDLTADYDTWYTTADLAANTISFSLRTVPKTYVEGMDVVFLADTGSGPVEYPATPGPQQEFTAEISCELTDLITLSAVFITGDTRQTQLLDVYEGLYSSSLPYIEFQGLEGVYLHDVTGENGVFHLPARGEAGWISRTSCETEFGEVEIRDWQVGLFKNFQLLAWMEPSPTPDNWNLTADQVYYPPEMDVALKKGDILHFAVIFTDEYGRQGAAPSIPFFECLGDEISWPSSSDASYFDEIERYTLSYTK